MKRKGVAWKKTLQKDVPGEERERRKRVYREIKNEVKRSKEKELGRKLSKDFVNYRKLYHRDIKRVRGGQKNDCSRVKDGEGRMLMKKDEVCFNSL